MKWSENLPEACSPNDACECESIAVYRFLNDNKDTSRNFLTVRELQPKRTFPELEKEHVVYRFLQTKTKLLSFKA
jgi:hypothetical protein